MFLLVFSTVYELLKIRSVKKCNSLLSAFSVYTNGKLLFDTSDDKHDTIKCLRGLKVFAMAMIIMVHQDIFLPRVSNPKAVFEYAESLVSVPICSSIFSVDTFLVIGGFLLTFLSLKALDKNRFSYPKLVFHRYIRFTLPTAVIILFALSLFKFCAKDAQTLAMQTDYDWLHTFLNLLNFPKGISFGANYWYISLDFQLFCLSPILIYPLWKFGWKFLCVLPALALTSSVYIFYVCVSNNLQLGLSFDFESFVKKVYYPIETRCGPWLVGMILGYIFYTYREKEIVWTKFAQLLLWVFSLLAICYPPYIYHYYMRPSTEKPLQHTSIYVASMSLLWSSGISAIIFCCDKLESGGIIRWILSFRYFKPIERMTLSMYLVHSVYRNLWLVMHHDTFSFGFLSFVSFKNVLKFYFANF